MRTRSILSTMFAVVATASLSGGPAGAAGPESVSPLMAPRDHVPFETVALLSDTSGINLTQSVAIPVRTTDDLANLTTVLATGTDPTFAEQIVAAADQVPDGRLALVGLIDSSCNPPSEAGLVRDRDGNVSMFAVDPVPNQVECFVAVETVAVLSVDPADVPLGTTDSADLLAFLQVGYDAPASTSAIDLTESDAALASLLGAGVAPPELPPLDKGVRRFAFVRPGCQETTAELLVTRRYVDVRLYNEPVTTVIACAQAEFFLAVFDVPAELVAPDATVGAP